MDLDEGVPTLAIDADTSLAATVFKLIEQNRDLKREVQALKDQLDTARSLRNYAKLYCQEDEYDPHTD